MVSKHSYILTVATLVLLGAGNLLAAEEPLYQVSDSPEEFAARFGWWGVATSGSQVKTGEYQGLSPSSPFWDVDGLRSDGNRTVDFYADGPEGESTQAGLHYYRGPGVTFNVDYERFIHRLDHKPATGFNDGPFGTIAPTLPTTLPAGPPYTAKQKNPGNVTQYAQDVNAGQDYAIRVQEVKANFKGNITEDIRWRLNLWGMKKEGNRQANGMAHCYALQAGGTPLTANVNQCPGQTAGARCHLLSQSQNIDWLTQEIEPVIEARITEGLSLEYSRTMRTFTQNDQMVFRPYNSNSPTGVAANTLVPYDVVPESTTDIDRLKLSAQLGEYTNAYALGYIGNNFNRFRSTDRKFSGVDGRITNQAVDGLNLTAYGKTYQTKTSNPSVPLNVQQGSPLWGEPTLANFDADPVDRQFNTFGATSRWRPWVDEHGSLRCGLAFIGGYEYGTIQRQNASYDLSVVAAGSTPSNVVMQDVTFDQPDSNSNKWFLGTTHDWSRCFKSNVKYTYIDTHYPLFGVTSGVKNTGEDFAAPGSAAINSLLPTHVDRVELGGTWQPVDEFMLNGTVYLEKSIHRSNYARFDQDSYPWMVTAWYGATQKLSFNGGIAQFNSLIDQDITLGSQSSLGAAGGSHVGEVEVGPSFTAPWRYTAQSDVLNLGAAYAFTERLSFNGGLEYVRGLNAVATPPSPTDVRPNGTTFVPTPYTEISDAVRVQVTTYRVSAGFDYQVRRNITTYVRYNYYDYGDATASYNSGIAHMVLGGMSASF